jgi:hypothetical protein
MIKKERRHHFGEWQIWQYGKLWGGHRKTWGGIGRKGFVSIPDGRTPHPILAPPVSPPTRSLGPGHAPAPDHAPTPGPAPSPTGARLPGRVLTSTLACGPHSVSSPLDEPILVSTCSQTQNLSVRRNPTWLMAETGSGGDVRAPPPLFFWLRWPDTVLLGGRRSQPRFGETG